MMKTLKLYTLILLIAVSVALPTALAQRKPAPAKTASAPATFANRAVYTISAEQLRTYLSFIASDEMEGRDTPSRGLNTVAKFIALNLTKWGFKPAGDDGTYFQKIALHRDIVDPMATFVEVGGQRYAYGDDVIRAAGPQAGTTGGPIVFAGNGWMIKSKNLNPYAGLDVKGKFIAVIGEGQPTFGSVIPLPAGITATDLPRTTRGTD